MHLHTLILFIVTSALLLCVVSSAPAVGDVVFAWTFRYLLFYLFHDTFYLLFYPLPTPPFLIHTSHKDLYILGWMGTWG